MYIASSIVHKIGTYRHVQPHQPFWYLELPRLWAGSAFVSCEFSLSRYILVVGDSAIEKKTATHKKIFRKIWKENPRADVPPAHFLPS